MGGDPTLHLREGDRMPGRQTFNCLFDAHADFRKRKGGQKRGQQFPEMPNAGIVWVQNKSGADQDEFAVLGIDSLVIDSAENETEFKREIVFEGKEPTEADHLGRFVVLLEPLIEDQFGKAVLDGMVQVRLNVLSTKHDYADVCDGDSSRMESRANGTARIHWRATPAATGEQWAVMDLGYSGPWEQRFELKTALAPGSSATAHPLEWTGSQYEPNTEAALEFTVQDPFSHFRGRAKDVYSSPHNNGSRGIAQWFSDRKAWEIVEMLTPHALMILGDATSDYSGDFSIDGVKVLQPIGGIITNTDPAGNVAVSNIQGLHGDEDDTIIAVWDEETDRYIAITPIFDSATVVTNFQVSGLTLQKKTRTIYTMDPDAESGWTTIHTGTNC
jgi:hypothetical protein